MRVPVTWPGVLLLLVWASLGGAAEPRPAVLIVGEIHARYAARPLHEMGIEIGVCGPGDLAARLATKQYNVAVVLANDPVMQQPLEAFLAAGGGVSTAMPFGHISRQESWFPNPEWAAQHGARLRWEQLQETDPANAYTDFMGAPMSWSTQIAPPVNEGVKQVLILVSRLGWWPPLGFGFSNEWTVVVRFAPSVESAGPVVRRGAQPNQPATHRPPARQSRVGPVPFRGDGDPPSRRQPSLGRERDETDDLVSQTPPAVSRRPSLTGDVLDRTAPPPPNLQRATDAGWKPAPRGQGLWPHA